MVAGPAALAVAAAAAAALVQASLLPAQGESDGAVLALVQTYSKDHGVPLWVCLHHCDNYPPRDDPYLASFPQRPGQTQRGDCPHQANFLCSNVLMTPRMRLEQRGQEGRQMRQAKNPKSAQSGA